MQSKTKREISDETAKKLKNGLVKDFQNKLPKGNITRDKLEGVATGMMLKMEKDIPGVSGMQKKNITFDAFNEILEVVRNITGIKTSEVDIIDTYRGNQELFDSLANVFKIGFKQALPMLAAKSGFGCCSK